MSSSDYQKIVEGVAIYKQKTSKFWWINITVEEEGRKKYIKKSSKETEKDKAIEKAFEFKLLLKLKKENNIPLNDNAPTFNNITKNSLIFIRVKNKGQHSRLTTCTGKDLVSFSNTSALIV